MYPKITNKRPENNPPNAPKCTINACFWCFFLFILLLSGGGNGPPGLVTRLIVGTEQPRTLETRE